MMTASNDGINAEMDHVFRKHFVVCLHSCRLYGIGSVRDEAEDQVIASDGIHTGEMDRVPRARSDRVIAHLFASQV